MQNYFPQTEEERKDFQQVFGLKKDQELYPYFVADNLDAIPKEDFPTICINAVSSMVKHHTENKYLVIKHHRSTAKGYFTVSGAVDEGEKLEEAAAREITEETGYKNVKFLANLGEPVYFKYFKPSKNQNRLLKLTPFYFQTIDDKVKPMTEYEKSKQEPVWLLEKDIEELLSTRPFHRIFWERMKNYNK